MLEMNWTEGTGDGGDERMVRSNDKSDGDERWPTAQFLRLACFLLRRIMPLDK